MYRNILVPVAFDEGHDTEAAFLAARKLASDDAKFTVLHVMEAIPAYVTSQIPDEIMAHSRDDANKALRQMAAGLPGATAVMATGHAGRGIVDHAAAHDIDCIVIASHKPGFENLFLGSTADRVVRHAKCAVHVIR
ncbi:universal stress protein [Ruegeria marina]|uniref:Nucleotide-binding universal stress protein, UspA family n=1 Tax=Ruegeria marina TaxID=639004 RepID=A0A1G6M2Y5_9RHOB|nr:universal stress protein [Ruegeria marina]SDC49326.1 Nucleotide-binding universal stress protein, UspA family [Ruegeria marina]